MGGNDLYGWDELHGWHDLRGRQLAVAVGGVDRWSRRRRRRHRLSRRRRHRRLRRRLETTKELTLVRPRLLLLVY